MTEGKQKAEAKIGSHRTLRFSQRACFSEKLGLIPLEHRFKKKKHLFKPAGLLFSYMRVEYFVPISQNTDISKQALRSLRIR